MAKPSKRTYRSVDLTKLSPKEKQAYKKRLAYVRKYTQAKREWVKRIRAGSLDPKITLDQFRGAKMGHGKAVAGKALVTEAMVTEPNSKDVAVGADVLVSKLHRLITELQHMDRKRAAIVDIVEKLGA